MTASPPPQPSNDLNAVANAGFESRPDIEWDASHMEAEIPDLAGVYRGHDGVRSYWRRWLSAWSDIRFEVQDVRDGGDKVVALIRHQHQTGRHSGIETDLPHTGSSSPSATRRSCGGKAIPTRKRRSQLPGSRNSGLLAP